VYLAVRRHLIVVSTIEVPQVTGLGQNPEVFPAIHMQGKVHSEPFKGDVNPEMLQIPEIIYMHGSIFTQGWLTDISIGRTETR
jgi:hypothetical protein